MVILKVPSKVRELLLLYRPATSILYRYYHSIPSINNQLRQHTIWQLVSIRCQYTNKHLCFSVHLRAIYKSIVLPQTNKIYLTILSKTPTLKLAPTSTPMQTITRFRISLEHHQKQMKSSWLQINKIHAMTCKQCSSIIIQPLIPPRQIYWEMNSNSAINNTIMLMFNIRKPVKKNPKNPKREGELEIRSRNQTFKLIF